jgi:biotin carboxylase
MRVAVLHGPGASVSVRDIIRASGTDIRPTFLVASGSIVTSPFADMITRVADARLIGDNEWVQAAGELAPDAVVTFDDRLVDALEDICRALDLRGQSAIQAPWDKFVQRQRLNTAGASSVRVRQILTQADLRDARASIGRSGILKPRRSSTGRGIRIIAPEHSTEAAWSDIAASSATAPVPYLYEELMDAHGGDGWLAPFVSVDTASLGSSRSHFGLFEKLPLARSYIETGHVGPSVIPADQAREILTTVETALDVLGIRDRITHTEVRLTSAGPQVIEVNGRLGGYVQGLCASLTGADATRITLDVACGVKPVIPSLKELRDADHSVVAVQIPLVMTSAAAARRITRRMRAYPSVRAVEIPEPIDETLRYAGAWLEASSRREVLSDMAAMIGSLCDDPADRDIIDPRWLETITHPKSSYL